MLLLVGYDISDNRRRYRVVKVLKGFGQRVQKSVFECDLEERRVGELWQALRKLKLGPADSIRVYRPDPRNVEAIRVLGVDHGSETKESWIL